MLWLVNFAGRILLNLNIPSYGLDSKIKRYNKYLTVLVFSVHKLYKIMDPCFSPSIYGLQALCSGHKSKEKSTAVIYSVALELGS